MILTDEQKKYLPDFIAENKKNLWCVEFELDFMEQYHKDWLNPGALMAARSAFGKAREDKLDPDVIAELENTVVQIKDCLQLHAKMKLLQTDITAKIKHLEGLCSESSVG